FCLLALALVVYGTVGPVGRGGGPWLAMPDSWSFVPPSQPTNPNDIFTNLVVYLPVGVALRLLLRRRGRAGAADLLAAVLIAGIMSWLTETLQQFMPHRSSNRIDIWMNLLGASIGAAGAPLFQSVTRRIHAGMYRDLRVRPWSVAAWLTVIVTALMMTVPFDLTWTPFAWRLSRPLDLLDVRRAGMFLLDGFVLSMALFERWNDLQRALRGAFLRCVTLGTGLEVFQVFLASHEGGLLDIVTALFGGAAGCIAAGWLIRGGMIESRESQAGGKYPENEQVSARRAARLAGRTFAAGALLTLLGASLILSTYRLVALPVEVGGGAVHWLPFQLHFLRSFDRVLADLAESLVIYGGATALCLYLGGLKTRGLALVLVLSHVAMTQMLDWLCGRGMDVTPLILAGGSWWLAVRFWGSLRTARAQPLPVGTAPEGREAARRR
ncbi:MAG: hypothetical protein D6744_05420, partial [Planctomycetota bacterium]